MTPSLRYGAVFDGTLSDRAYQRLEHLPSGRTAAARPRTAADGAGPYSASAGSFNLRGWQRDLLRTRS